MKIITFLLVTSLLFTACAKSRSRISVARALDKMLSEEFKDDSPGGSVLVRKEDKIVFLKNYGLADIETKEKINETTLFNLGSISKTFVSNGILILSENGLLSLEDTLYKYFDDFKNAEIAKSVSIKHLLSHTSGLPDNRRVEENPGFYLTARDAENFAPIKLTDSLNFIPGEKYEYSNPAFNGLALIIEKISGMPWQKFIADRIFKPSGMTDSRITDGPYPEAGVAHGYVLKEGEYTEYDYGEYPTFAAAGNGGVWSSVKELAMYEEAIGNNIFLGNELTAISRSIFRPSNWKDQSDPFIGYGWFIGKEQFLGERNDFGTDFIYHTGDQGGFMAFYILIPEKDILYIGLFNRPPEDLHKIIREGISLFKKNNWLE